MTTRIDTSSIGAPAEGREHHHHRLRAAASLIAAIAGGLALLIFALLAIGGVGPGEATAAWVIAAVLVVISLTGLWWRWDSPDARSVRAERERRGF